MATSSNNNNKPVTGYPAQPMTGYPATAATGTAYPYQHHQQQQQQQQQPPPNPYYQAMAYPPPPPPAGPTTYYYDQSNGRRIVRRLIIGCIILFSIMALIFFISWLVLKPHLPEFRVNSASVSQLNATLSQLTATWAFTLFVNNPNHKLTISYDKLQASVLYNDGDSLLGVTALAPFQQGKRNQTTVSFEVRIVNSYVGEGTVKSINEEKASPSGSVDFGVKVMALVRFRAGIWRMREHLMRVYCDPLKFSFSSNNNNGTGTLLPQSQPCDVAL